MSQIVSLFNLNNDIKQKILNIESIFKIQSLTIEVKITSLIIFHFIIIFNQTIFFKIFKQKKKDKKN